MPLIRRWQRMPVVYQWATLCGSLVIMLAASIVAIIGLLTAQSAGREAKSVSTCVNTVLGSRGGLTSKSAEAQRTFAEADEVYNHTINDLINHPARTPAEQKAATDTFKTASANKERASKAYQDAMSQIVEIAKSHPLGRC